MRLCSGERMVAVADGKDEIGVHAVKTAHVFRMNIEFIHHFGRIKSPSCQMPAVHVEVEIIQFLQLAALFVEGLDDVLVAVVQQKYDVRQFDERVLADGKARGDSVGDDAFRSADGRLGGMHVGIFL